MSEKDLISFVGQRYKIVIEHRTDKRVFRHFVTEKNVHKLIGRVNANKAFFRAISSKGDKYRVKIRKSFILDFYSK